jgi:outer membrane protein assembly factor BamB
MAMVRSTGAQATPVAGAGGDWPNGNGANAARTRDMPGPAPAGQPNVLWTFPGTGGDPSAHVAGYETAGDGALFINGIQAGIFAIDLATGQERWRSTAVEGAMQVDGDGVIARSATPSQGDGGYDLLRLSTKDGHIVWRAEQGKLGRRPTPVVADGVGYIPSGQDLVAFDPKTGRRLWAAPMDAPASRGASVADGVIVLGDVKGTVYAFAVGGGTRLWTYHANATTIGHSALANGMAYVVANDIEPGALYALDLKTGALRWSFHTDSPDHIIVSPSADEKYVYASSVDGVVTSLDAQTGTVKWTFKKTRQDAQSVTIVGDTAFVEAVDKNIYALDRDTGQERWHVALDDAACSLPVVVGGVFYVGSCQGTLYAIGGSGGSATPGS